MAWEIFRGDMFQLEIALDQSLLTAIELKASMKQIKDVDIRLAIGIGTQEYKTKKITESNGSAYSNSGLCFENLKSRRLAIKTPWEDFDSMWNLNLRLASLAIDHWTPATAQVMEIALKNPNLNQKSIAKKLKKSQSTISANLKRAGYEEIYAMLQYFADQIGKKM